MGVGMYQKACPIFATFVVTLAANPDREALLMDLDRYWVRTLGVGVHGLVTRYLTYHFYGSSLLGD